MRTLFFFFFFLFNYSFSFSQNIIGNWKGNIDVNGQEIPIVFHFYKNNFGKLDGKWDSPAQKAMGLPFTTINSTEDSLNISIAAINGAYKGRFINKDSIAGIWLQGGNSIALNFKKSYDTTEASNEIARPEQKEIMYPNEKEISITSSIGNKIYGTLLSKNNHQKLVIIIAGSGPTDRDGNNPLGDEANSYKLLAHSLDSQNIATFRFDKRGVAKSVSTNFKESDLILDDYIKDAEKIYDYLHDTLGFKDIYFAGHSEGSLIGMIASQKKKVQGYISIAGAGRPIDIILEEQINKQAVPDSIKNTIHFVFSELKKGKVVNGLPSSFDVIFRKSIQPYMISWLKYTPEKEIMKLKCPILILQGGCDIQVKVEDANNLHKGNPKSVLNIIPLMTHTLKSAGKDCVDQQKTYTDGTLPIDTNLVNSISEFIKKN
ncbi:MAG TPA: alpha/beta fold hydrolase [Hanamia sp.]